MAPCEAAQAADHLGPPGPLDGWAHELDRPVTGRHVDPGRVRRPGRGTLGHRTPARGLVLLILQDNLWLATSYGTGTG